MVVVIRSSLALSLGMVGALSIIRFRTAVKEVEQIIYFLMLTSSSIAVAAEKYTVSLLALLVFFLVVLVRSKISNRNEVQVNSMNATVTLDTNMELFEVLQSLAEFMKKNEIELKATSKNGSSITLSMSGGVTQALEKLTKLIKGLGIEKVDISLYK